MSEAIDIQFVEQAEVLAWSDVRMGDILQLICSLSFDDSPLHIPYEMFMVYDPNWTMKSMILSCSKLNLLSEYHKVSIVIKMVASSKCQMKLFLKPCRELFIDQVRPTFSALSIFPDVLTELILAHL